MSEGDKITPQQMQKLQKWIASKTRGRPFECSICAKSQWTVLDYFVSLKAMGIDQSETHAVFPHVALSCGNCGQTLLMNALKANLWD